MKRVEIDEFAWEATLGCFGCISEQIVQKGKVAQPH